MSGQRRFLAPLVLPLVLLLAAALSCHAAMPLGSLGIGQFGFCAGNPDSGPGSSVSIPGLGTSARLSDLFAFTWDTPRNRLWVGTPSRLDYIDENCNYVATSIGSGSWQDMGALAILPNGTLVAGDGHCRLTSINPEAGTASPFSNFWGSSCSSLTTGSSGSLVPVNTLGGTPTTDGSGQYKMGIVRGMQYSSRDNLLYIMHEYAWEYAEVWTTDGVTTRVIAQYQKPAISIQAGWANIAVDPFEDYFYTVTFVGARIFKSTTKPPYTTTQIFTAAGQDGLVADPDATGVSNAPRGSRIGVVTSAAGQFGILFPVSGYTTYGPTYLLNRNGQVLANYKTPAYICPGVANTPPNYGDCWNIPQCSTFSENGIAYLAFMRLSSGATSVFALRVFAEPALLRVEGGAHIEIEGASIQVVGL